MNVRATQSSSSAPMEISWSHPPNHRAFKITGYRIFYGSRQNVSVSKIATSIGLELTYDGQTVFIRSESDQLYSEQIVITVGRLLASFF